MENELEKWDIAYGDMMAALMLLYAIGFIESDKLDICKSKNISDAQILGLGKMIINIDTHSRLIVKK